MAINNVVVSGNLGPEFEIGTGPVADKITIKVDGSTIIRDGATGELSAVTGGTDSYIDAASYASGTLTLGYSDAKADITADLSALDGVSGDAGNLLGVGGDGKPTLTSTAVCADITANCLEDIAVTDAFGNALDTVQGLQ